MHRLMLGIFTMLNHCRLLVLGCNYLLGHVQLHSPLELAEAADCLISALDVPSLHKWLPS